MYGYHATPDFPGATKVQQRNATTGYSSTTKSVPLVHRTLPRYPPPYHGRYLGLGTGIVDVSPATLSMQHSGFYISIAHRWIRAQPPTALCAISFGREKTHPLSVFHRLFQSIVAVLRSGREPGTIDASFAQEWRHCHATLPSRSIVIRMADRMRMDGYAVLICVGFLEGSSWIRVI